METEQSVIAAIVSNSAEEKEVITKYTGAPIADESISTVIPSLLAISNNDKETNDRAEVPENDENSEILESYLETAAEADEANMINRATSEHILSAWPDSLVEDFDKLPNLGPETTIQECQTWIKTHRKVAVRAVTWNLMANPPASIEEIQQKVIPKNKFHIYVIGSEECENSIAYSMINTNKDKWLAYLEAVLGPMYLKLRSHTLQAIHITLFVHKYVAPFISDVTSTAVASGLGNTLGNKGGASIYFKFGITSFLFTNAHLAAHQNHVNRRNADFKRINVETPLLLKKLIASSNSKISVDSPTVDSLIAQKDSGESSDTAGGALASTTVYDNAASSTETVRGLDSCADRVIFMGDLNYRIRGNRAIVEKLLEMNMHDVLIANDQLKWSMANRLVLEGFSEPPLTFRPTFKFDKSSDTYDTSSKKRVPAWTDRILYFPRGILCLSYDADMTIRTSDHRPVYASFLVDVVLEGEAAEMHIVHDTHSHQYTQASQVCSIM